MFNNTSRFSKTVENYLKYRPDYPKDILRLMQHELGLNGNSSIGDIGSGTGKLTALLLQSEATTFAVEPNQAMREAAEQLLGEYVNFRSVNGTAEYTNLPAQSLDFITVAQAFHWFDYEQTKLEFLRLLRPGGSCLIIWNKRADHQSDFMYAYNAFLQVYSTDLKLVNLRKVEDSVIQSFLGEQEMQVRTFDHVQVFDWNGLKGRYLSCSYALMADHAKHQEAMQELETLFNKYQVNGSVNMCYSSVVYYAQML